jgi:hypothetical protein
MSILSRVNFLSLSCKKSYFVIFTTQKWKGSKKVCSRKIECLFITIFLYRIFPAGASSFLVKSCNFLLLNDQDGVKVSINCFTIIRLYTVRRRTALEKKRKLGSLN